jgi:hypothetical protein
MAGEYKSRVRKRNNTINLFGIAISLLVALAIVFFLFLGIRIVMFYGFLYFSNSTTKALIFMKDYFCVPFIVCAVCYPLAVFVVYRRCIRKKLK